MAVPVGLEGLVRTTTASEVQCTPNYLRPRFALVLRTFIENYELGRSKPQRNNRRGLSASSWPTPLLQLAVSQPASASAAHRAICSSVTSEPLIVSFRLTAVTHNEMMASAIAFAKKKLAGVPGLEPRTTEPESAVLPITPHPTAPGITPLATRHTLAHP